jgi:DNA-binding response OmpR family regulator
VEHRVPVLFVTGHASEREIVAALTAGADDYMVKPVRVAEMLARITALLRRSYPRTQSSITTFGRYTFDSATCTVTAGDMAVVLKDKEFRLAFLLFANLGRLLSRSYLVQAVWGTALSPGSRSLDTHLSRVRSALALRPENGMRLSAVYSHGYRLESLSAVASEAHLPGLTEDVTKNEAER